MNAVTSVLNAPPQTVALLVVVASNFTAADVGVAEAESLVLDSPNPGVRFRSVGASAWSTNCSAGSAAPSVAQATPASTAASTTA